MELIPEWLDGKVIGAIAVIIASVVGIVLKKVLRVEQKGGRSKSVKQSNSQSVNQNFTIHNHVGKEAGNKTTEPVQQVVANPPDNHNKNTTSILFIDDQYRDFRIVAILKKAGWKNTIAVRDVTDLDDYRIVNADVLFVDINGVGTTLSADEGRGLARALKEKYPAKKVVLYSAETIGDRFDPVFKIVDASLPKDADPIQFIQVLENLVRDKQ